MGDGQGRKGSQKSQGLSEGRWTNLYPELYALAAISSTEAWALGEYGRLLRMTKGAWTEVDPPELRGYTLADVDALPDGTLWTAGGNRAFHFDGTRWWDRSAGLDSSWGIALIDATSSEDVWAAGFGGVLAHWDGTQWEQVSLPQTLAVGPFRDIEMLSNNEGWLLGDNHNCGRAGCSGGPAVLHYSGGVWAEINPPSDANVWVGLNGLSITPSGEVWTTGANNDENVVYRYSNGSWQSWAISDALSLFNIEMLSPTEGWVTGRTQQGTPAIWVWDKGSWKVEYQGRFVNDLQAVEGHVWAVGRADTVLSRSIADGSWSQQRGGPVTDDLREVDTTVASGPDEFWAIGEGPTRHFTLPTRYYILHHSGGTWTTTHLITTEKPLLVLGARAAPGIDMLSPQHGWAWVGNKVFKYDGSGWRDSSNGMDAGSLVTAISAVTPDNVWAVALQTESTSVNDDDHSVILHWNGTSWKMAARLPVHMFLADLDMVSATEGWAIGQDVSCCGSYENLLWRFDGTMWRDSTDRLPSEASMLDHVFTLRDIELAPGGSGGWAAGGGKSVLHLEVGTWRLESKNNSDMFDDIALEALGEAWFLQRYPFGFRALAHHYSGGTFREQKLPLGMTFITNPGYSYLDLSGIALVPGRGGWMVGDGGTILRYDALGPGQRYYDVQVGSTFYTYIESLASRNIVNGYAADNTFRPTNFISRGQLAKIVSNSAGFTEEPGAQRFQDVPPGSPFYAWVQRLAGRGHIGGYPCGGPGEPCEGPANLPYFRPVGTASRGQISKIAANAAELNDPPGGRIYADVPEGSPFYDFAQRLSQAGVMSGYQCGSASEPCDAQDRPYFRPGKEATRGQVAKIVSNTFFPGETSTK